MAEATHTQMMDRIPIVTIIIIVFIDPKRLHFLQLHIIDYFFTNVPQKSGIQTCEHQNHSASLLKMHFLKLQPHGILTQSIWGQVWSLYFCWVTQMMLL